MDKNEILKAIKDLAQAQGFYGRLLRAIEEDPEILNQLEQQQFSDTLDLILYLES